jgi:hypothetical protein
MWLLKKQVTKRRLGFFAKLVSSDELRAVRDSPNELPPLQKQEVCYILIQVRDDSAEDIQRFVCRACDILLDDGALVEAMMSSIICAVFEPARISVNRVVDNLLAELGQNVRIAYGRGEYLRGTFGSPRRFTYGTIFPNFSKSLLVLFEVDYGASKEICNP